VIVTDEYKNASREFSGQMISELIEARKGQTWAFVFLGTDETTFEEGEAIGVSSANTTQWDASSEGTSTMFSQVSQAQSSYRAMSSDQRAASSERFLDGENDD